MDTRFVVIEGKVMAFPFSVVDSMVAGGFDSAVYTSHGAAVASMSQLVSPVKTKVRSVRGKDDDSDYDEVAEYGDIDDIPPPKVKENVLVSGPTGDPKSDRGSSFESDIPVPVVGGSPSTVDSDKVKSVVS